MKAAILVLALVFGGIGPYAWAEDDLPKDYTGLVPQVVEQTARSVVRVIAFVPGKDENGAQIPELGSMGSGFIVRVDKKTCRVEVVTAQHVTAFEKRKQLILAGGGHMERVHRSPTSDYALMYGVIKPCENLEPVQFGGHPPYARDVGRSAYLVGFPGKVMTQAIYSGDHQWYVEHLGAGSPTGNWWPNQIGVYGLPNLGGDSGGAMINSQGKVFGILVGVAFPAPEGIVPANLESVTIYLPFGPFQLEQLEQMED